MCVCSIVFQLVDGNQLGVNCRSVQWNSVHHQCFISEQQIAPHGINAFNANPETIYLEKFCLKGMLIHPSNRTPILQLYMCFRSI